LFPGEIGLDRDFTAKLCSLFDISIIDHNIPDGDSAIDARGREGGTAKCRLMLSEF
jgi:hypothetical protein